MMPNNFRKIKKMKYLLIVNLAHCDFWVKILE